MFEDAQINGGNTPAKHQQYEDAVLSTDDLVMMIGVREVRLKEADVRTKTLFEQASAVNQELMKSRSRASGLEAELQSKTAALESEQQSRQDLLSARDARIDSLQQRITDLEEQVHKTALERDEARAEKAVAVEELAGAAQKLEALEERVQELIRENAARAEKAQSDSGKGSRRKNAKS